MDPRLVYELKKRQYAAHVCSTLGEAALRAVSRNDSWRCSELPTAHPSNLIYPSITVPLQTMGFSVVRTLTNVTPPATLEACIHSQGGRAPRGQEASYHISVGSTGNSTVQGAVY
ncbi:hypothetical protein C2845_PM06G18660 [Panicum miliaceum]|uniref:Uncharacterized protein n=1 Tax=Panicum miliaceum TaxID=4540 RepID=A0A3L6R611_PANMI|nr:hypothetical protein C2845_PM06G18660 [Panicum miliaceum]